MFYLFAVVCGFAYGGLNTMIAALIGDNFGLYSLGAITGVLVVSLAQEGILDHLSEASYLMLVVIIFACAVSRKVVNETREG